MATPSKVEVHESCLALLNEKINGVNDAITDVRMSSKNETKSSAGDKHETARAMAHLELEKLQQSIGNLESMKSVLDQIDPNKSSKVPALGALVKTSQATFYIAISLGPIKVENTEVMIISINAPIIRTMSNCEVGSTFSFNNKSYQIMEIS